MSEKQSSKRVRLLVAYDGTEFRGLAPNVGVRTVVGELQTFLAVLLGVEVTLVMSGRTDAGVHAWGQVLSADVPVDADLGRIQRSINSKFGPEIVVREISIADLGFSARYSAVGRRYRYTIVNRSVPDPFLARTAWWVPDKLSLEPMKEGAGHVIGQHDFSSFCRQPKDNPDASLVRKVTAVRVVVLDPGDVLRFEIEGSAFCHQMVRSIVGYLVAVGRGKRTAADLVATMETRDRAAAVQLAPPHGLCLWQVDYPPQP